MSTQIEEEKPKKRKKMDKGTACAVILAFVLGIGVGLITSKEGERAEIRIEKCSESLVDK